MTKPDASDGGATARKFGRRLSDRIFIAATVPALAFIVVLGGTSYYETRTHIQENIVSSLNKDSEVLAEYVGGRLGTVTSVLSSLSSNNVILSAIVDSGGRDIYLEPLIQDFSVIHGVPVRITITDFQGMPIAGYNGKAHGQGPDARVREAIEREQPHAEIIQTDYGAALRVVTLLTFPRTGTIEGAIVYETSLVDLLPPNVRRSGSNWAVRFLHRDRASDDIRAITVKQTADDRETAPANSIMATSKLSVSDVLAPLDLAMQVAESDEELQAALGWLSTLHLVLGVLSLVIVVASSFWAGRYLTRSLRKLEKVATNVAANDSSLRYRVAVSGADETARLGAAFNGMLERIEDAHHELRSNAEYLRAVMDHVEEGIIAIDRSGRIESFNNSAERIFGYTMEEIRGQDVTTLMPEFSRSMRDRYRSKRERNGRPTITDDAQYEATGRQKDGSTIPLSVSIGEMNLDGERIYIISLRDISVRKRNDARRAELESALRQAQKMEALGTLAGGTAHEFNNLLAPIMGLTELAMHEVPADGRTASKLAKVLESAQRAARLVEKILSFSRKDEASRSAIDLAGVVDGVFGLLQPTLPATIAIRSEVQEETCFVSADESQIHQVLINLASNAADAMEGEVGELVISLSTAQFDRGFVGRFSKLDAGSYAQLSVRDNGHGMDEGTMLRMFDPFFTTKAIGKGTGMGLAMIHGIVAAHGGGIAVESEPGRGTMFTIYLPLLEVEQPALLKAG